MDVHNVGYRLVREPLDERFPARPAAPAVGSGQAA